MQCSDVICHANKVIRLFEMLQSVYGFSYFFNTEFNIEYNMQYAGVHTTISNICIIIQQR